MSTDLLRGMSTDLVWGMSTDLVGVMFSDLVPLLDVQTSPNVPLHFSLDPRCHGLKNYITDHSTTKIMSSD